MGHCARQYLGVPVGLPMANFLGLLDARRSGSIRISSFRSPFAPRPSPLDILAPLLACRLAFVLAALAVLIRYQQCRCRSQQSHFEALRRLRRLFLSRVLLPAQCETVIAME